MAGENHSQDETDGSSDDSDSQITDETEGNVATQPCTCVEGQAQKCESCRTKQRLNSKAYRQRVAAYKNERDDACQRNVLLQEQLDAYRVLFIGALEHQSKRCQGCGTTLPPVMLPSDAPTHDGMDEETRSVVAEGESFLRQLKPPKDASSKSRARKFCSVCEDARTCAECLKREKNRVASSECRKRKQQDGGQAMELVRLLLEVARKQGVKSAELSWQNAKLKEACRRCAACGGIYNEDSKQGTDAPPHKRAAFAYYSSASGRSPAAGPSGLQSGGQEAVNSANVLREASKKDDVDDNASIDGHYELLRGTPSVGTTYTAPPSPPLGSHPESFALRSADAANVMLTDVQRSQPTEYNEDLELALEIINEDTESVNPIAISGPSLPASILGEPDQQPLLDIAQGPSTGYYSDGGASRSNGPSQSAAPANSTRLPHGSVRRSGPSDDASDTSGFQADEGTTKKLGLMHSAYQAVRSLGMKTRSSPKEKNVFARTQIVVPTIPPASDNIQFKSPSLASKHDTHSQPLSSSLSDDGDAVGVQSMNIYHFIPPDAPTVESDDEGNLLADYELVDEMAVLTLEADDYGQHGTAEQQENLSGSAAVNEADQMPEASVDASGFSNAGAMVEKPEETEESTSSGDESSDDDTEESGDEANP